jgi:hypothetical protein
MIAIVAQLTSDSQRFRAGPACSSARVPSQPQIKNHTEHSNTAEHKTPVLLYLVGIGVVLVGAHCAASLASSVMAFDASQLNIPEGNLLSIREPHGVSVERLCIGGLI